MVELFFHRKTYNPENQVVQRMVLVRAALTFTPLCPAIVPGRFWEPTGDLASLDFVMHAPECDRRETLMLLCRAQLGTSLSMWLSEGFALCFGGNDVYCACAELTCWALEQAGMLEHFGLHNPRPIGGRRCMECGCPGVYQGFLEVECVNRYCPHYKPPLAEIGAIRIPF